jgi:hypothetical protein
VFGSASSGTMQRAANTTDAKMACDTSHASAVSTVRYCPSQVFTHSLYSVPGSGSFIRPSSSISYGSSFLTALREKYVESLKGGPESVILGSSNGAIEVDASNLDMIRRNLALLDTLLAVSLGDVAVADAPGEIIKTCPSR